MGTLEARQLTKCYLPSVPAVLDLSFCLTGGQVLGFVGPNGSGKSTTVKMLTGLLQPTRGQVLWCGAAIQHGLLQYRKRILPFPCPARIVVVAAATALADYS